MNTLPAVETATPPTSRPDETVALLNEVSAWLGSADGLAALRDNDSGGALIAGGALHRLCRLPATTFSLTPGRSPEWSEGLPGAPTLTPLWPIGAAIRGLQVQAFRGDLEMRNRIEKKQAAYVAATEALFEGLTRAGAPPELTDGVAALLDWLQTAAWRHVADWDAALKGDENKTEVTA